MKLYSFRLDANPSKETKSHPADITVVIASYRYGHLAAHCIESVIGQTKRPLRIIFVDDGAGDCNHLINIYPEVEFIFRPKNLGVTENFQDILERIESKYTMFVGADNWLRSDSIELLSGATTDIVTYDIIVTGDQRTEILNRHPREVKMLTGDFYWTREGGHHGSMLYRTALGKQVGYRPRVVNSPYPEEDWNLWNGMRAKGATVSHIKQGLLFYRRHRENFLKYKSR